MNKPFVLYRIDHETINPSEVYVCNKRDYKTGQAISKTPRLGMAKRFTWDEAVLYRKEHFKKDKKRWHIRKIATLDGLPYS